jgi:hypothetical protein
MPHEVPIGSSAWFAWLGLLLLARGADFLSTWIASPTLALEGNPIAKKLGWFWGMIVNAAVCLVLAHWPMPATILITMSMLLAARNFQLAWVMRAYGEQRYRDWYLERLAETPPSIFLLCLAGQTVLFAVLGLALAWLSQLEHPATLGVGVGMFGYALAVALYTVLALRRNRRRFASQGLRYPVSTS